MKRYSVWFVLGAALVIAMMGAAPLSAQTNDALVRIEPETIQVGQGQVETISIVIENGSKIYGIDVRAEFDPNVFEIVDADSAKTGIQMTAGGFIKPDFVVRNEADNESGTLQYVITQVNPTAPANGNGIVLEIMVRGKTRGQSTAIKITHVELADRRGTPLKVTAQSGTVKVVAPKAMTATPRVVAQVTRTATRSTNIQDPTRVPTRPRATSSSVANETVGSLDLLSNIVLIVIAVGGCLGATLVLGLALVLVFRRSRNTPPRGGFA